jgi:hypothetical protein
MAVAAPSAAAPVPTALSAGSAGTAAFAVARGPGRAPLERVNGVECPHLPHVLEFSGRGVLHFGQNIESPRDLTAVSACENYTGYNPNAYVCITVTALAKASSVDVEMGV